jgi:hypothetical protein
MTFPAKPLNALASFSGRPSKKLDMLSLVIVVNGQGSLNKAE